MNCAAIAASPAWWPAWAGRSAWAATPRRLTPAQTEGPFYPVTLPADTDADLLRQDVRLTQGGEPTFVSIDDMDGPTNTRATPCSAAIT